MNVCDQAPLRVRRTSLWWGGADWAATYHGVPGPLRNLK